MGRATLILANDGIRAKAKRWIDGARPLSRVEFKGPSRSLPQNAKMWAMLTEVSEQAVWYGKRRSPEQWKDLFTGSLKSAAENLETVPGLTGGFMLLGLHTSEMDVAEMVELIEWITAWGALNDVTFADKDVAAELEPAS
jgi:hypothetical protein